MKKIQTLEMFLSINNCFLPHSYETRSLYNVSNRAKKEMIKKFENELEEYKKKRKRLIQLYNKKLLNGEIRSPTNIEKTLAIARGYEDLESTQASRRVLTKRGIDWKTGKKERE